MSTREEIAEQMRTDAATTFAAQPAPDENTPSLTDEQRVEQIQRNAEQRQSAFSLRLESRSTSYTMPAWQKKDDSTIETSTEKTTEPDNYVVIMSEEEAERLVERRRQAEEIYNQTFGEDKEKVTISELLERSGAKTQDIQDTCRINPELAQNIGGGETCRRNTQNASRGLSDGTSICLTGAQKILPDSLAHNRTNDVAYNEYRKDRPYQGKSNGGCCTWYVLNNTGDYISVELPNQAYGKQKNGPEDQAMNEFIGKIKSGNVVSWDSIEDTTQRIAAGNTAGGRYGHVAIKGKERKDGTSQGYSYLAQSTYNNARYGKYIHVSFPKDAEIPADYAKKIIEQSLARIDKEKENNNSNEIILNPWNIAQQNFSR